MMSSSLTSPPTPLSPLPPTDQVIEYSISDLKRLFAERSCTVTLQCAGNRRRQMAEHKPIYGATSGITAISNAVWTGVRSV